MLCLNDSCLKDLLPPHPMFPLAGSVWGRLPIEDQHHANYLRKVHIGSLTHHVQMDTHHPWSLLRPHLRWVSPPRVATSILSFSPGMHVLAVSDLFCSWRLPTCAGAWPPSGVGTRDELLMDPGAARTQLQPPRGWRPPATPLFRQQVFSLHRQNGKGGWHPSEKLRWKWVDTHLCVFMEREWGLLSCRLCFMILSSLSLSLELLWKFYDSGFLDLGLCQDYFVWGVCKSVAR